MFKDSPAFSSFSVDDVATATEFYTNILGLDVTDEYGIPLLQLGGGGDVMIYPKEDHVPSTFTVLNFPVEDIEKSVAELKKLGVTFEQYPEMGTDEKGITPGDEESPRMAWFKDPAGNILSLIEMEEDPEEDTEEDAK